MNLEASGCVTIALAILLVLGGRRWLSRPQAPSASRWLLPLLAALLSAGYVEVILRGGPRVIDATSYLLEARAIAAGRFTWPTGSPEQSITGRFLLAHGPPMGREVGVIFPPGYPLVLALAVLLGHPMLAGPIIAGLLTFLTMRLVASFRFSSSVAAEGLSRCPHPIAERLAGGLTVVCATLRYHTADTMAHGWSAVCVLGILVFIAHESSATSSRSRHLASGAVGLTLGWLIATRPASGAALGLIVLIAPHVLRRGPAGRTHLRSASQWLALGAATVPGLALLIGYQFALTREFKTFAQMAYYNVSDGPVDCFRYGFGAGIGCRVEHGQFVEANLSDGYGLLAAVATTGRRLKMHLSDIGNFPGSALLVPLSIWHLRHHRAARVWGTCVIAVMAAYVPFYFDGNYPGGGARLFADVLPIEIAIVALGLTAFRSKSTRTGAAVAALAASLAGFLVFGVRDHLQLRDRDGGFPMIDMPMLMTKLATFRGQLPQQRSLVFVDTDHAFNQGHVFGGNGPLVVRRRDPWLDRQLWLARDQPAAYDWNRQTLDQASRLTPRRFTDGPTLEAEALLPPVAQSGGYARKAWPHSPCTDSNQAALVLRPTPPSVTAELRLMMPPMTRGMRLDAFALTKSPTILSLRTGDGPQTTTSLKPESCTSLKLPAVLTDTAWILVIEARSAVALDRFQLISGNH